MRLNLSTFFLQIVIVALVAPGLRSQIVRTVGRLQEVFAWRQLTFNMDENMMGLRNPTGEVVEERPREKRQMDALFFSDNDNPQMNWNQHYPSKVQTNRPTAAHWNNRPGQPTATTTTTTAAPANDDPSSSFIQYNNLPMGVERVGDRLFVTVPRRRYGIPSTLNYLDLRRDSSSRSPGLRPYPDQRQAQTLTSVYRTRADECGRLWMVDTGLLEIPGSPQQIQPPAIVVYDLNTNRELLRYPFKSSDIPAANTPTGLASITVDITNGDCRNAYAYVPDLTTYGLIVYSMADNDSWRLTHNYFSFNPTAGNLNIARQRFQWSDGIFSITLADRIADGCKLAYFHPMVSTQEFSVSTCVLKNRTANTASDYWTRFNMVGDRGSNSQSTMHGYHASSSVIFFADIGRDAVSCWNTGSALSPASIEILAKDSARLSYPSDLHVSGDEVWVMANSLPTWAYARLDTNEYNFFIYKYDGANVQELISGTVCDSQSTLYRAAEDSVDTVET